MVFDHNDQMQYHIMLRKKIEEEKKVNQLYLKDFFFNNKKRNFLIIPPNKTEFHLASFGAPLKSRIN